MKITRVESITYTSVETDNQPFSDYVRYAADNWFVWMGDSLEPEYNCTHIEELYQEYIKGRRLDDEQEGRGEEDSRNTV